jgi:hypothetical protein
MDESRSRSQLKIAFALAISLFFIISADATFWSSKVEGDDNSSWSIYRQSQNLSFDYSQSVQGTVSPVDYHGRSLSPYYSSYQEMKGNDIRLRGRTSALQGDYSSEESIYLRSDITDTISITLTKEANSPFFLVDHVENWPAILKSSKWIEYSGKGINDRQFAGNNLDYAGSNLLYNKKLSVETNVGMLLTNMNATVLGMVLPEDAVANDTLISAYFMPNRETSYRIWAETTGIADLKYRLTDSEYDFKRAIYPALSKGEERYVGEFRIFRSIYTKSKFENASLDEYGISCCFTGYSDMNPLDKRDLGIGAKEIFDCSCYNAELP